MYGLKARGELTEEAPLLRSDDPYCDTKVEAEQLCRQAATQGLPVTVLRLPAVYGPGSRLRTHLLGDLLLARRFPLLGGGEAPFACTYIDDAVTAVLLALQRPEAAGQVYNVIGQQTALATFVRGCADALRAPDPIRLPAWPVRLAAAAVAAGSRALGQTPPLTRSSIDMLLIRCTYNGQRFRQLGWRPEIPLAEGLRRAAAWYQACRAGDGAKEASPFMTARFSVILRGFVLSQAVFWAAWWIGYLWLPEGLLRGGSVASRLPLEHLPMAQRIVAVIAWNALWALLFAAGANFVRVGEWPLGLTAVLTIWAFYGLVLGTNSFAEPLPVRPAPSLLLVLQRAGFLEALSYLLFAAATPGIARWRQASWLSGKVERIAPSPLSRSDWLLLGAAFLLLVLAAVREGVQWCGATGGC